MLDWGPISQPPCYTAAVHNMKAIAKCTADLLTDLRQQGLRTEKLTCIGHSLGKEIHAGFAAIEFWGYVLYIKKV